MANPSAQIRTATVEPLVGGEVLQACGPRQTVRCGTCHHQLFDGIVVRSRIVRLLPRGGAEAMCRCKAWLRVPLTYHDAGLVDSARPASDTPAR